MTSKTQPKKKEIKAWAIVDGLEIVSDDNGLAIYTLKSWAMMDKTVCDINSGIKHKVVPIKIIL